MTELTGVRRGSLVDEVIERLRAQITSGAWPVGARIPPESELVAQLQVGRGTVREAIKALAHGGLLEVRQGDGTYVKARSELAGAIRRHVLLTSSRDVLEVRRAIEVEAARDAAKRRTDEDLAIAEAALVERDRYAAEGTRLGRWDEQWASAWVAADLRFHKSIVDAAHNPMLTELYEVMLDAVSAFLVGKSADDDFDVYVRAGHYDLVDALRARDEQGAMREALHNVETHLED